MFVKYIIQEIKFYHYKVEVSQMKGWFFVWKSDGNIKTYRFLTFAVALHAFRYLGWFALRLLKMILSLDRTHRNTLKTVAKHENHRFDDANDILRL